MRLLSKMFSFQGWDSRLDYLASIGMSVAFLLVGVLLVFGLSKVLAPASMEPDGEPTLACCHSPGLRVCSHCRNARPLDLPQVPRHGPQSLTDAPNDYPGCQPDYRDRAVVRPKRPGTVATRSCQRVLKPAGIGRGRF